MQARNRRFSPLRAGAAFALTLLLVLPEAPAYAQRARAGGDGRGSVRSVNRNASGTGGSWSGRRTSGTTSRSVSGNTSSRTTSVEGRGGQTATGTVSSGTAQAGQRFQGNLDSDLVTDGRVVATRGTRVYGRVVAAQAGTGTGGAPQLTLELTDVEVGGRVVPLATEPVSFSGEAKKAGKKVLGAAALGAGIGGMIDGGEGAAWGAGIGAVAGAAAATSSPGNQVAVAAGTALEFRLAQPLSVAIVI